jgi:HlyD family secretion protein
MQLIANQSELARAENELKVALNENEAEVSKAEVDYHLAEMELQKYREGEYPQRLMELETEISIAREELQRAQDKLEGSRKLEEKGYITGSELQADTLAATRAQIKLQLSEGAKRIYETYTYKTDLEIRVTDAEQKRLALERVRHQATSREQFARTNLANQRAQLQRRDVRLAQVEKDIANCKLYAPADGMVIYATTVRSGWNYREPYAVGREIDERQDMFYIPSSGLRNAELTVHESNLELVKTGMPARVRAEAIPNAEFTGMVSAIGVMPNQESEWTNPNLKVFDVEVELNTDDEGLRTGMSCLVEVIVHRYRDVHYIPVQAVAHRDDQPFVYVRQGDGTEIRPVEVGLSDNRMTAILSGLRVGEEVLLSPPFSTDERAGEEEQPEEMDEEPMPPPRDEDDAPPDRPRPDEGLDDFIPGKTT